MAPNSLTLAVKDLLLIFFKNFYCNFFYFQKYFNSRKHVFIFFQSQDTNSFDWNRLIKAWWKMIKYDISNVFFFFNTAKNLFCETQFAKFMLIDSFVFFLFSSGPFFFLLFFSTSPFFLLFFTKSRYLFIHDTKFKVQTVVVVGFNTSRIPKV